MNSEVGVYLYGRSVITTLGYGSLGFGNVGTEAGKAYQGEMEGLMYGGKWDQTLYNQALNNFKNGATVNQRGIYNNFRIREQDVSPVIKKFFPLIR